MVMKGSVQPKHIPVNNYELLVEGLPSILFTEVGETDQETETAEMPDRTVVSGGNEKATETTCLSFEHHRTEVAALESWRREGLDPVTETYKKTGTLIKRNVSGEIVATESWIGVFVKNRKNPKRELSNEGEPAMIEWTLSIDKIEEV